MTTLGPIDAMLDKLTIESAKELGNGYVVYARGMAYVIDAVHAALSSLPTQAVGVKARTSAWLAYWPGAGSIDSVTRVTRSEHEAKRWRDDGAEVTELVERSSPSQPAAVGEGEATCECCGGPALTWFAPNKLWNLVQGGPEATDDPGGMLCPNCFILKAEAAGIVPTAWVLATEHIAPAPTTAIEAVRAGLKPGKILMARDVRPEGFSRKAVFNALTYLARRGEIERIAYGQYRALEAALRSTP